MGVLLVVVSGPVFAQDPILSDELRQFYQRAGYRPVWVPDGVATLRTHEVIRLLEQAEAKGLDPRDYAVAPGKLESQDFMAFDYALTEAVMRYVSDLRDGRANPGVYRRAPQVPLSILVREQILEATDLNASLRTIEPPFPAYWRTLDALEKYRALALHDDSEHLPSVTKSVEPGDSYAGIPRLVRLLGMLGDLPADAPLLASPSVYAEPIVDAVKRFQSRHGLEADGRIGKATLAQLNTPLSDRVRQLELALERWRWLPREFSRPPVLVNLPEFRLRALDSSLRPVLEMKIIAGAARHTPTPLLSGGLHQVIFRPYWNVPYSIVSKELLPHLRRDPAYLAANHYEVTTSRGEVVTSSAVSEDVLTRLRSGQYLLRQAPGSTNALGLVKFLFPNDASVYLHDTPGKSLFAKVRRDFSHGCIRLEKAPEFAAWALQEEPEWTRERIDAAMNGSETLQVNLKKSIPLMVTYITAVVLETGEVRFLEDLYGYDKRVLTSGALGPRPRE